MAKKHGKKAYFGLGRIISLILAIFPVTSILFGIITRLLRGTLLGAILNFVLCPLFWIIDLITVILYKDITVLA